MIGQGLWFTVAVVALLAPGVFVARALGLRERFVLAVIVGPVVLFQVCYALYLLGQPIRFGPVLIGLLLLCGALSLVRPRVERPQNLTSGLSLKELSLADVLLLLGIAWVAGMSLFRGIQTPLTGWDTFWRWEGLSCTILETGTIGFYPPIKADDFRWYPWPEAVPPGVAFVYWWLYAAVGMQAPRLTGVVVFLQYATALALVWKLTRVHFGPRAALYATACAAGCPLLFRSINIGQETGLLTVALLGLTYFLTTADRARAIPHLIAAACCAALAGLCREYGLAYFAFGLGVCALRRLPWRATLVYSCVVVALVIPWYVRTAWLTGNPFYSLKILDLPIHMLLVGYLESNAARQGLGTWSLSRWGEELAQLFYQAPLQVTLLGFALVHAGRRGVVLGGAILMGAALWLMSIGPTDAGAYFAQRVLGPTMAVACVLVGGLLQALLTRHPPVGTFAKPVLVLVVAGAGAWASVFPLRWPDPSAFSSLSLRWLPVRQYGREKGVELTKLVPRGARILTMNNYMQTDLRPMGIDVVQIWSPDVAFLTSPQGTDPAFVYEHLRRANIRYFFVQTDPTIDLYFQRTIPLYRFDRSKWGTTTMTLDKYTVYDLFPTNPATQPSAQ